LIIKPLILGDAAYPSVASILKSFDAKDGNEAKMLFDKNIKRGRVIIENCFGWLKNKWQILKRCNVNNLPLVPTVITTCCILHNYLIMEGERIEEVAHIEENSEGEDPSLIWGKLGK
jgi:hypothetical protein